MANTDWQVLEILEEQTLFTVIFVENKTHV